MKMRFNVLLGIGVPALLSSFCATASGGPVDNECKTRGYVVDRQQYFLGINAKDAVQFDEVPDWLPESAIQFLSSARNLGVGATHEQIVDLLDTPPELTIGTYRWGEGSAYQYKIRRFRGCVSELAIYLREVSGKFDGQAVYIRQNNRVDNSAVYLSNNTTGGCQFRKESWSWNYKVDDEINEKYSGVLPDYIESAISDYDVYNQKYSSIIDKYGPPSYVGELLVWNLSSGSKLSATATVSDKNGCAAERLFKWTDSRGHHHELLRASSYDNMHEAKWYVDMIGYYWRIRGWIEKIISDLRTLVG